MKRAIVVGGADCVLIDLAQVWMDILRHEPGNGRASVFICNDAYRYVQRFDHWVTLHPEKMDGWISDAIVNHDLLIHETHVHFPKLDSDDWRSLEAKAGHPIKVRGEQHEWRVGEHGSGSTGLFATRLAISFGYDRVILAGVPMDSRPHIGSTEPWADLNQFAAAWSAVAPELMGKVRSMSGWTRELLGKPTSQWWSH